MRVAVITWDGGSNREPFEVLCRGLLERAVEVHVLSNNAHRSLYEGLGATFVALPLGDKTRGERPSAIGERVRVTGLSVSPEIAEAVVTMLTATLFDVALVDAWLATAFAACEVAATPFIVVHHSLPGAAWSGPRREQFEALIGPVNDVRRSLRLPALTDFRELMGRAATHIVPTAATLDTPAPWDLPLQYVGPLQPVGSESAVPELPPRFVLVSFSTTWQRQIHHLQNTVDALALLDRAVVVTTGPSIDPAEVTVASNTVVVADLPHRRVLDRVDAVVTHAGHGTVLSALTAGVPIVCMPMGRDQHDVTRCVIALGAGLDVSVDNVTHELLPAVRRVLSEPQFAQAAADVSRSIAEHGGLDAALAIVDHCVQESGPRRPV